MDATRRLRWRTVALAVALALAACTTPGSPTTTGSGPEVGPTDASTDHTTPPPGARSAPTGTPGTPGTATTPGPATGREQATIAGPGTDDDRCWDIGFAEDDTSFDTPAAALAAQAELATGAPDDDPAMATLQAALERAVADPSSTTIVSLSSTPMTEVLLDEDEDGAEDVVVSLAGNDQDGFVVAQVAIAIPCDDLPPGPTPMP